MTLTQAALLGLVEGLTEFVPVSSTGHLILASHALGLDAPSLPEAERAAVDAFDIVVQAGAWLACVIFYAKLLLEHVAGLNSPDRDLRIRSKRLIFALAISFVPMVLAGLMFRNAIKAHLFGPVPVAVALVVGGVIMIAVHVAVAPRADESGLERVTLRRAVAIGLAQCLALFPGMSRSMSTMAGGMLTGLDARTAAHYSFLLAVPTLGAATCYEAWKERAVLVTNVGAAPLIVGLVVAGVVGWLSIAFFLKLLGRHGLLPWGIYRVIAGAAFYLLLGSA